MSLSDWTIYKTNSSMQVAVSATNPILGDGSLRISRSGVGASNLSAHLSLTTKPHGFTRGRLRSAYRLDTHSGTVDHGMGLLFMQSQTDLTQGSGSAYALVLHTSTTAGNIDSLRLVRYDAGISAPTTNVLANVATGGIALGTVVCLEAEWALDTPVIGQMTVTGRSSIGFQKFVGLVQQFSAVLTTSVLLTSVGEGPFVFMNGTGDHASAFGETGLFEMA